MNEELNASIIEAHNAHYANSKHGLIDVSKSPNENIIYHLYSTGEIGYQKGGAVYMRRSEIIKEGKLYGYKKLKLVLPKQALDGTTYAILTDIECSSFREIMMEALKTD